MLRVYGFDLAEWIAGRRTGSARVITAMLNNLPEGSKYVGIKSAPGDDAEDIEPVESDPEETATYERMVWTLDRKLLAQLINAIQYQTRIQFQMNGQDAPEFPVVGPSEWQEGGTQAKSNQPSRSVMDVLAMFG